MHTKHVFIPAEGEQLAYAEVYDTPLKDTFVSFTREDAIKQDVLELIVQKKLNPMQYQAVKIYDRQFGKVITVKIEEL